jgi:cell division protease FtsH
MIEQEERSIILERKAKLQEAQRQLKTEYFGIDAIIDELITSVEPWFLFPKAQLKPTIINLWGMTSVGKTSLIKRLFEILDHKYLYHFDIGKYSEKSQLTYEFQKMNRQKTQNTVIIFDEFQLGRTVGPCGEDIERQGLRVVWDLLDTGKLEIIEENWASNSLYSLLLKLNFCLDNGVIVSNGNVIQNLSFFNKIFNQENSAYDDREEPSKTEPTIEDLFTKKIKNSFIPRRYFSNIRELWPNRFLNEELLFDYLETLNGLDIIKFIQETSEKGFLPVVQDLTDSIVFIIGNLDDVYHSSHNINPDIDADEMYEDSKKITLTDVKKSLKRMFRSEQISRLGNNHLVYTTLNSKHYTDIIKYEISKIKKDVQERFNLQIIFDDSVVDFIYKEGVFPAQGVRPVLSTIKSVIEVLIGKVITEIVKEDQNINRVNWKIKDYKSIIDFYSNETLKFNRIIDINSKIDKLRQSDNDDRQALVGIHEAGHVVNAIFALNILPKVAVSKTANDDGGFTDVKTPTWKTKGFFKNQIVTLLGGYCAEKIVFGKDNLTYGSTQDMDIATMVATSMIKEFGMAGLPIKYTKDNRVPDRVIYESNEMDKQIEKIIKKQLKKSNKILEDNKLLLLKLGEYLTEHSKISDKKILKMVKKFAVYDIPKLKTSDNYYNYKELIHQEINKSRKNLNI